MQQYADLLRRILKEGKASNDRTGVGTLSLFGPQIEFDLSDGFPIVTGKYTNFDLICEELRWFLSGSTNVNDLDSKIWDGWRAQYTVPREIVTVEPRLKEYVPHCSAISVTGHDPEDKLVQVWLSMMHGCYSAGSISYSVCERWHQVADFIADVQRLPHWWYKEQDWDAFELSLSYYSSNQFGPDTCVWLRDDEVELDQRFALIPDGEMGKIYSHNWRGLGTGDQIAGLVSELKRNPDSRRFLVTSWIPESNLTAAMPACHTLFQCRVQNGALSLKMYQRSGDMFLGVPFNIASYALLLRLLAYECGLDVGSLIVTFGDCHIYKNHIKQVEEYLARGRYELPSLRVTGVDFDTGDFSVELTGYEHGDHIAAPVAI